MSVREAVPGNKLLGHREEGEATGRLETEEWSPTRSDLILSAQRCLGKFTRDAVLLDLCFGTRTPDADWGLALGPAGSPKIGET